MHHPNSWGEKTSQFVPCMNKTELSEKRVHSPATIATQKCESWTLKERQALPNLTFSTHFSWCFWSTTTRLGSEVSSQFSFPHIQHGITDHFNALDPNENIQGIPVSLSVGTKLSPDLHPDFRMKLSPPVGGCHFQWCHSVTAKKTR